MADLGAVPCAGGDGACPFAGECDCGSRCHCLCYPACDEGCADEMCALWHTWFGTLPDEMAREIIRVCWVEPMKVTLGEALIKVMETGET